MEIKYSFQDTDTLKGKHGSVSALGAIDTLIAGIVWKPWRNFSLFYFNTSNFRSKKLEARSRK